MCCDLRSIEMPLRGVLRKIDDIKVAELTLAQRKRNSGSQNQRPPAIICVCAHCRHEGCMSRSPRGSALPGGKQNPQSQSEHHRERIGRPRRDARWA